MNLEEIKQAAGIQDNPDQEGLDLFARLIIQKSIEVMVQHDYHGEWLGEKIKEHFGVEE
jgi:hypothetical protein